MQSYRITLEEKEQIENSERPDGSKYAIQEDLNGDFFIWELEHQDCGFGIAAEFLPPSDS